MGKKNAGKWARREMLATEAEKRRAVRALEAGETWRSVARRFNVKTGTLTRWRREYGTKATKPTKRFGTAQKMKAVALVGKGIAKTRVAREVGVSVASLSAWCRGDQLGEVASQYHGEEFKRRAVRRLNAGESIMRLAEELGVTDVTLRSWRRRLSPARRHTCEHCRHYMDKPT